MNFTWAMLFWFLREVATQSSNCDFYDTVSARETKNISSPNYPNNYGRGLECRWIIDCPTGYNCRLDCPDINLPQSTGCMLDKLLVSSTGNPQLAAAETYCGVGSLVAVSTRRRMVVGLITNTNTNGGKFSCQVSTQPVNPSTNCNCGMRRQNRIVGGQETGINEYPMMAGIVDARISEIKCGGTIISNYYVLTAAHCLTGLLVNRTAVVVGEHNVSEDDSPATKVYRVSNFIKHPQYSSSNYDFDISIVTVRNAIVFNQFVGPICLPFKFRNWDFSGATVTMLGWGTLFSGGPNSNTLQKVDVKVITQNTCRAQLPAVTDRQMCTFTRGKDACQNDYGGPVLYSDTTTGRLFSAGIISHGRSCASRYPSVNTRVTVLLDWIVQNTPGANYCVVQ